MTNISDIKIRQSQYQQMVEDILAEARRQGAGSAEAQVSNSTGLSVSVRKQDVETIEHTRDQGLGVTVYFGHRKGSASSSDFSPDAIRQTVRAACNIARYTEEDPCAGLADPELMSDQSPPDLDLYHPWGVDVDLAIRLGKQCEAAACDLDPRITNSEGATTNTHDGVQVYGNSHGFIGGYPSSRHSLSCAVIGQQDDSMQRDYWYTSDRVSSRLESPETVGRIAAERTLARLGARKIPTCEVPVLFKAEVAVSLLRNLTGAISGSTLYRKASFLVDQLGAQIFPGFVRIYEDPLIPRGPASSPFDGEGVATQPKDLVRDGILKNYVLSSYSARKLGMRTTANAGGVRNLFIEPGDKDFDALIRTMHRGLVVTEMLGQGLNMVTGDYSRGATGFWVENGEIQYPVEEITIAGNLKQ